MGFTLQTHKVRKDKRTGQTVNTATDPYVRISGREGVYFVQHGQVWSEGGQLIDPVPGWVMAEIEKLSERTKREVQWGRSKNEQSQMDKRASEKARAAPLEEDLEVDRSSAGAPTPVIMPSPEPEPIEDDDFEEDVDLEVPDEEDEDGRDRP